MFKLGSFPLLIIPVILYNIMAFFFMNAVRDQEPTPAPVASPTVQQEQGDAPVTLDSGTLDSGTLDSGALAEPDAGQASPAPDVAPQRQPTAGNPDPAQSALVSETAADRITETRVTLGLPTGGQWQISIGDLLLILALALLFLELVTSTRASTAVLVNHTFSLILFVACLVEFLLLPAFATSVFFIIMLMTLLDVLAGFIVTTVAARRDISLTGSHD